METKERVFSVELKSKRHLKTATFADGTRDNVLLEGNLGELVQARFADGVVLEIVCKNGLLRVDLEEDEIKRLSLNQSREPLGDKKDGVHRSKKPI